MNHLEVVGLQLGSVEARSYGGREVRTAGHKQPQPEAELGAEGFVGDEQGDRRHHGGPDKAVCVYAFDHYPFWEEELGRPLPPGAFGENLTLRGALETQVCLGDIYQLGTVRVQVSQPRQPCFKLAGRHGREDLPELIHHNGFSGFYFRVLAGGPVRAGAVFSLEARHPAGVTLACANQVMYRQRTGPSDLERVLGVEALSAEWRRSLEKRRGE